MKVIQKMAHMVSVPLLAGRQITVDRLVSYLEPIQCKEISSDAIDRKWIA